MNLPSQAEVFPLWSDNGKLYRPFNWQTIDFTDLDWSVQYEDYSKKHDKSFTRPPPNAYAVRGGKSLSIIDIDNKSPGLADETLHKLMQLGLDINTFTVKSKSGGYHLYYLAPSYPVKTCTGWLFPNVDIRGMDGYVVGPDLALSSWSDGNYVIVNDTPPLTCELELPAQRKTTTLSDLPVIDLPGAPSAEDVIPHGARDSTMLYFSGQWVADGLSDEEIAANFAKLKFESVSGDNPSLEDFMEKVTRDRLKATDIMQYTLSRFVFVEVDSRIYDKYTGAYNVLPSMELNFPATIIVSGTNGAPRAVPILREWIKHPDRVSVWAIGFKPTEEELFEDGGRLYYNEYRPINFEPWDEPVTWDDPELSEYRLMMENLASDDDHTLDMMNSQRAAKVQDLTWTPHWGFILISTNYRIGKDFSYTIFSKLLGRGTEYFKEAEISDVKAGRNEYLNKSLTVLINEPGGLKDNFSSNTVMESIKKLFSEELVTVKLLYSMRTGLIRTYRIPEVHSNHIDAIKLHKSNRRFAPIVCRRLALDSKIYKTLGKKVDSKDNKFMRKLLRFYKDYPVSPKLNKVEAPIMSNETIIINESRGDEALELDQMIEDNMTLFKSDMQTDQSMMLAIRIHMEVPPLYAKKLWNKYKKEIDVKIGRVSGLPIIEYDQENITSMDDRVCKVKSQSRTGKISMVNVYAIRNYDKHFNNKSIKRYIADNFFPNGENI